MVAITTDQALPKEVLAPLLTRVDADWSEGENGLLYLPDGSILRDQFALLPDEEHDGSGFLNDTSIGFGGLPFDYIVPVVGQLMRHLCEAFPAGNFAMWISDDIVAIQSPSRPLALVHETTGGAQAFPELAKALGLDLVA